MNTRPTYWYCEPGWEWKSNGLADHLLWYVMDGVGVMRLGDRRWELQAGSCFVFAPTMQPHGMQDPERRLIVFGMHFDIRDPHAHHMPHMPEFVPALGHVVRDTAFFAMLAQRCDASFRRGDRLGVLQSQLFLQAMVLQLWEEALYPAPSTIDLALDQIIRAIQQAPGRRWTVAELARQTHLSRAQFVRRFRSVTGVAPTRFIIQARLERARHLIQETDMTLTQIASVLGYEDVSFFSRQYKRYYGCAPSGLRRC